MDGSVFNLHPTQPGHYLVQLKVTDDDGGVGLVTCSFHVAGEALEEPRRRRGVRALLEPDAKERADLIIYMQQVFK